MNVQLRNNDLKRPTTAPAAIRSQRTTAEPVREDRLALARRRIASGYYESDVCLDITIRRLARELNRPVSVVVVMPGRAAQTRLPSPKSRNGRRG